MASADRLIEVFNEAKARPVGAERDRFLSEACHDEPALKEQVLSLLQAHEGAGDFLKNTQVIPPVTVLTEKPGDKIGRYKLLQKIGEGGCGVVYMAEQEEPVRRRVAFKVIKLGMDTKQVVARFEAEGQALAMMDHPNIAKVFDAGATNTGRPYFVMELVRGIKITEYCDQNNLPTDERLKLFTQVCHAIQHAHQKGIIHRDIKPSNILVTINDGVPVPKVIDFGIAKAIEQRLTDKTVFTAFEQFIGTPAYMSPEQAEMTSLDIDTRADVYSLGVLLYELLSGNTPFDAEKLVTFGIAEIRRIIREQEPPKPSTRLNTLNDADRSTVAQHRHTDPPKLLHLIRGDLDWIVMKCLEKDRTRRYETANGLAMDLQRHLDNEPVVARRPTNLYRFQKLVRRHKLAFVAASAIVAALAVGLLLSCIGFLQARRQAQIARTQAARSAQVAQFMKDMLAAAGPKVALGRDTTLLREILDNTANRLEKDLAGQPQVEADLRHTLGLVYRDIGDYPNAAAMLEKAYTLRKRSQGEESIDAASSLYSLADVYRLQGHDAKAESSFRKALQVRRKLLGNNHPDTAASLYGLAEETRRARERLSEAESEYREALKIQQNLPEYELAAARSLCGLAIVLRSETATNNQQDQNLAEAEKCFRTALEIQRSRLGEHPDTAYTLSNLGYMLKTMPGKRDEAERLLREAVTIQERLLGDHRDTAMSIYFLAGTVTNIAEAETLHREALNMRRKVLGDAHRDTEISEQALFKALEDQGKLAEAESLMRDMLGQKPPTKSSSAAEDHAAADAPSMTTAKVEKLRQKYGNNDARVASALARLAQSLAAQGKPGEANSYLQEALAIEEKLPEKDQLKLVKTLRSVGATLLRAGNYRGAEAFYRPALKWQRKLSGNANSDVDTVMRVLTSALRAQKKYAEVLAIYREEAELGDASASYNVGCMYATGVGAEKNPATAATWWHKAADQDYAPAQFCLSRLYASGYGVARDEAQAAQLFRKASEATNALDLNEIAWSLATWHDANLRDATNAVFFAGKAVAASGRTNGDIVDTLAAAYAEAGQFEKAASAENEAIALIKDEKKLQSAAFYARLKLYQANKPYHQSDSQSDAVADETPAPED